MSDADRIVRELRAGPNSSSPVFEEAADEIERLQAGLKTRKRKCDCERSHNGIGLAGRECDCRPTREARPIEEYHEDMGDVLWWKFPIVEPPYVGSPLDLGRPVQVVVYDGSNTKLETVFNVGGWPGYHTHFTMIETPTEGPVYETQ